MSRIFLRTVSHSLVADYWLAVIGNLHVTANIRQINFCSLPRPAVAVNSGKMASSEPQLTVPERPTMK